MVDSTRQSQPVGSLDSFKAIPLGTLLIVSTAFLLLFFDLVSSNYFYNSASLTSTGYTSNPFTSLPRLIGNPFVHSGFYHFLVAVLAFPVASSGLEHFIGSFQFIYLFFIASLVTSFVYVLNMWLFSWIWPTWGLFPIAGLDVPFFTFIAIEGLAKRGVYEFASRIGNIVIHDVLFSLPFVIVFLIFLPFTSWIAHFVAVFVGFLYFMGLIDFILLKNEQINALETAGVFAWFVSRPNFVPAPGAVSLPMPGSFPSSAMDPSIPSSFASPANDQSVLDRVKNAFRASASSKYTALSGDGYQSADADINPLLWDEDELLASNEPSPPKSAPPDRLV